MGFFIKWDISKLVQKLSGLRPSYEDMDDADEVEEAKNGDGKSSKNISRKATFLTGTNVDIDFADDDVTMEYRFRAHADMCNSISYVKDLDLIATCGFDCNVYMFSA